MAKVILSASLEDYLETIYRIIQKKHAVRTKDISKSLGVKNPSVTGALRSLAEKDLINYAPYDVITLTDRGKRLAKEIYSRHKVLRDFFIDILGIDKETAEENACKMEHDISKNVLDRLTKYVEFLRSCPKEGSKWIPEFNWFCENPGSFYDCKQCIEKCLQKFKDTSVE